MDSSITSSGAPSGKRWRRTSSPTRRLRRRSTLTASFWEEGHTLERAGRCADYLRDLDIPILGICLGMQLMGTTFGGKVVPGSMGGYAEVDVQVLKEDDILKGLPPKFKTWASHMDQVSELPVGFEILARSNVCEIEAMKHLTRPLYGVQWHPEVVHTEYGPELLDNFIALCKR